MPLGRRVEVLSFRRGKTLTRSGWVIGTFSHIAEPLSGQSTQLLSQFHRAAIRLSPRALIPSPQPRAQSCGEEVLNRLVDSRRVSTFEHLKQIVCGYQGMHPAEVLGSIARLDKVAVKALLQLRVFKVHDAPLSGALVKMAGTAAGTPAPPDELVRSSCGHASLTMR